MDPGGPSRRSEGMGSLGEAGTEAAQPNIDNEGGLVGHPEAPRLAVDALARVGCPAEPGTILLHDGKTG